MPRVHAKNGVLLLDEIDFSAVLMRAAPAAAVPMADATAFADTDVVRLDGKPVATLSADGLWDKDSPNYDQDIFDNLTTERRLVSFLPRGRGNGDDMLMLESNVSSSAIVADLSSVVGLNVQWQGVGSLIRGLVALDDDAFTSANENGPAQQLGAIGAERELVAFVHVLGVSGNSPNLTVRVQSSSASTFGSATTRITFPAITDEVAHRRTFQSTSPHQYWRIQLAATGGGSRSFDVVAGLGFAPIGG